MEPSSDEGAIESGKAAAVDVQGGQTTMRSPAVALRSVYTIPLSAAQIKATRKRSHNEELREARTKDRAGLGKRGKLSVRQTHSVAVPTQEEYEQLYDEFCSFEELSGGCPEIEASVDATMTEYFDSLFLDGLHSNVGGEVISEVG